ncbi:universal stress protein [Pseudorhodobacter sp. E13]|uniref:universal stress protein n=1 Tax=Pseudorhodobacter sp. E13 TaxID=2487931 RepID=UPI000F8F3B33|nr:universal stress protein [Pseudorhodobacter sp. E13]RUS58590.1 universal stress protein [Pseudorhodobacter sp. E13]
MSDTIVVACDGSDASGRALAFAHARAKQLNAKLLVVHVLEWSPYSFLTPEEIAERHARRTEELARAESAIIGPIIAKYKDQGVAIETAVKYGHVIDTLVATATKAKAVEIISGRTGNSGVMSRVFGSVAGTLAQVSPVPCTIVP